MGTEMTEYPLKAFTNPSPTGPTIVNLHVRTVVMWALFMAFLIAMTPHGAIRLGG
jgi:hypothetical protein